MSYKKFATQLEEEVIEELKSYSKQTSKSISGVVNEAVREYLQKARVRPAFQNAMEEVLKDNSELLKRLAK